MKTKKSHKGQSIVEFALVLPILLILILGVFEVSRVLNAGLVINYASREAARYAALGGTDLEVVQVVSDQTPNLDASNMSITITPSQTTRGSGDNVTVTVTYDVDLIIPLIGDLLGNMVTVDADTTMRVE